MICANLKHDKSVSISVIKAEHVVSKIPMVGPGVTLLFANFQLTKVFATIIDVKTDTCIIS